MKKVVAIGGGKISKFETLKIDEEIVKLTGKANPKALFIPTASGEPEGYCESFDLVYGKTLGCKTDVLFLIKDSLDRTLIEDKILWADLIYVGGGNTKRMMEIWRSKGVDKMLIDAYQRGTVLSGLSAGAICWFKYGFSDSLRFQDVETWSYIKVEGLGLFDAILCPHLDEENRREYFEKFMMNFDGTGIGLENGCAIEIIEDTFRIIKSFENAHAYVFKRRRDKLFVEEIKNDDYLPFNLLS